MKTYLLNLWDSARTSYWLVPSLFAAMALIVSFAMPLVDETLITSGVALPEWVETTTDTARSTLSAMAGAMIAVTGTVFSITIVVLSLTSQQFGPRLLRRFMYDVTTQITLGVFLSTGFYCLLLLRVVERGTDSMHVPHLSIFIAVALAVLSMMMLIIFIHHIATLIQAPNVVAAVATDLNEAIVRLFPETIGNPAGDGEVRDATDSDQAMRPAESGVVIGSKLEGYIQAIDGDNLIQIVAEHDVVLRLQCRPGDFIAIDSPLAKVLPGYQRPGATPDADELTAVLNRMIIVGFRRTPRQDLECAIDELVEIAVRSLSPGINDPFTAINCIDRLGASLSRLAERRMPAPNRYDEQGRLRVIASAVSFAGALDAAFNQIRQYANDSVAVTIRLLEALAAILPHTFRAEDRVAVKHHARMIARVADAFTEESDKQAVHDRLDRIWNDNELPTI